MERQLFELARRHTTTTLVIGVSALAGATAAFVLMVARGWPPPLVGPLHPAYLIVPFAGSVAGLLLGRRRALAAGAGGLVAALSAAGLIMVVAPAWLVAKALDCWLSWLDC